jgi:lipopolysaccharide export system permease protein
MRLSATLSLYLGRRFLVSISVVLFALLCVVSLFEVVELMRRASGKDDATLGLLVQMAFLKLPLMTQKILPFAALFGGMYAFARMTSSHELVVARAAGVSVWQFLAPALVIALAIGTFSATVFNPLSSAMVARYEQMEAKFLRGRPSLLALSPSGLWLRQADNGGQSVIHAAGVSQEGMELEDVIVFRFEDGDKFAGRIDARSARLVEDYWELTDALLTGPDREAVFEETARIETTLTANQIQESFAAPETLSFWALPRFIEMLQAAGFSAVRHRLHWNSVAALPVLLCSMVLIAATFTLRATRRGRTSLLIAGGVLAGFALYFLSDVIYALGLSGAIPVVLAAWTPAGVTALLGMSMLFHLEDG